jgi:Protein of unknown function (DUF3995)
MSAALALAVSVVFLLLALWHVWMALHPVAGLGVAVPSAGEKPLFAPSRTATFAVAAALVVCAILVSATGSLIEIGLAQGVLAALSYALALGLLIRAVGDFRYVGFFKRVRGTRFAHMDSLVYSPACALLALAVAAVAWNREA